jgi:organic radical activating enzyme
MMTIPQIVRELFVDPQRVVITGGEPLIHPIGPLLTSLDKEGYTVHIETNGTQLLPPEAFEIERLWVTCSPKTHNRKLSPLYIDEIKYLIDTPNNPVPIDTNLPIDHYFFQPIRPNSALDPNATYHYGRNISKAIQTATELCSEGVDARVSPQLHQLWHLR